MKWTKSRLIGLVLFVIVLLGAYAGLSHYWTSQHPRSSVFPTWTQLGTGLTEVFSVRPGGESDVVPIVRDTKATLVPLLLGLAGGVLLAVVVGIKIRFVPPFDALLSPAIYLSFLSRIRG